MVVGMHQNDNAKKPAYINPTIWAGVWSDADWVWEFGEKKSLHKEDTSEQSASNNAKLHRLASIYTEFLSFGLA